MITPPRLDQVVDLPLGCPQTALAARTTLLVGGVQLADRQRLRFRWLSMSLYGVSGPDPAKACSSLGLAFAGLYPGMDRLSRPAGAPVARLVAPRVGITQLNPYYFRDFTTPGYYALFVTNNTDAEFELVVTGTAQLYLD